MGHLSGHHLNLPIDHRLAQHRQTCGQELIIVPVMIPVPTVRLGRAALFTIIREISGVARRSQTKEDLMPFVSFHDLCPDVAERETRCLTVMPNSNMGVPPGDYSFVEMFCNED